MKAIKSVALCGAAAITVTFGGPLSAETVLKASHQFPGGKGDARDEIGSVDRT